MLNVASIPTDTIPSDFTISDYETKSLSQLTGALVMVSIGGASLIAGVIGYMSIEADQLGRLFSTEPRHKSKSGDGYGVAIITGAVLALASIPLFVESAKNKKLVRSASLTAFKMETANKLQAGGFSKTYFPAIKLTLRF